MIKIDPFTRTPGKAGEPYIDNGIADVIIANFQSEDSSKYVYKITGIRGSGKTVEYGKAIQTLKEDKKWLVYPVSAKGKGAITLLTKMSMEKFAEKKKTETEISANASAEGSIFSLGGKGGLGITRKISDEDEYHDIEASLTALVEKANRKGLKVLIGIDDISMTPETTELLSIVGSMIAEGMEVYLIVSGLSKNIEEFSSDKSLSFFRRGDTMKVGALNKYDVAAKYEKYLGVTREEAKRMYDLTLGYAYAYQVLGSLYFNKKDNETLDDLIPDYENDLFKNSYELIRKELSDKDRDFIRAFYASKTGKAEDIKANMTNPAIYDMYRKRLINKHIFDDDRRGYLTSRLPMFEEFFKIWCEN